MYCEGVEADYFRNKDEMIEKLRYYIGDPAARNSVASNGYEKVLSAGHDIDSRMQCMLSWIAEEKIRA